MEGENFNIQFLGEWHFDIQKLKKMTSMKKMSINGSTRAILELIIIFYL